MEMMSSYKRGSSGEGVKIIQEWLGRAGLPVLVDGVYGYRTEEAIKEFQAQNNLKPDGVCGLATMSVLMLGMVLPRSKRVVTEIIVHCTATTAGKDYTVEDIRCWHKQQGWSDIGYHYVVYRDGSVHPGRNVDVAGAHCSGHNTHSIGVVYVGGLDKNGRGHDTRTFKQKDALLTLLKLLKKQYPSARIYGHSDFAPKDCPCFNARKEYADI